MDIHEKVGYSLLCLVAARIIWGFVGSEAARFREFLFSPRTVLNYLRVGGQYAGHNPLGGLSVTVLLLLLLAQAGSGVFSRDDLLFEGPFSYWAGDLSGTLTEWHKTNWLLLQGFIVLHLLAVCWYQWRKKQPLVQAMWRGQASYKFVTSPPKPLWWAVLIVALLSLVLWGLVLIAPEAPSYY
jgi:cytochrome b